MSNKALKDMGLLAVAVSGGADSLYSLASLKAAGARLFAMHAVLLPPFLRSTAYTDMLAALRAACAALQTELIVVDLSQRFEELVIKPFAAAYLGGLTPNPCAFCNRLVKFGLFWEEAASHGANRLVTGHYVRLVDAEGNASQDGLAPGPALYAAADESKDQSYFLALTPLEKLARGVFPLAGLYKRDVLASLEAKGLTVPQPGESQEICFVPHDDYRAFLQSYAALPAPELLKAQAGREEAAARTERKNAAERGRGGQARSNADAPLRLASALQPAEAPAINPPVADSTPTIQPEQAFFAAPEGKAALSHGPALLPDGTRVGTHYGLWNYTQGQRHGLGIAWKEPLFVLGKDLQANALLVGPKAAFGEAACTCAQINFLVPPRHWPAVVLAKTRYRQQVRPAEYRLLEEKGQTLLHLRFMDDEPAPPPAPGQVAALYAPTEQGLRLLAGAVIL